ncbi:MAG: metal ABC transporter solute-binding protein, Zn/Mn family [Brevefilum sp.]
MKKEKTKTLIVIGVMVLMSLIFSGCQSAQQDELAADETLSVTVSIPPQAYFVEQIAGDAVQINVMVGSGDEPHTYEPTPEQMRLLSNSQVFYSIGVEYEQNWVPRFQDTNPDLIIVDSASGIQRIAIADHDHQEGEDQHNEEEGHGHDQEGENLDPHVWLSPENGKIIAANILDSLITLIPEGESAFQDNFNELIAEIDTLETNIETTLSDISHRTFMVFHPTWGYFADQFDLEQVPVQVGGQEPSPQELANLVEVARDENIRVIFIQPSFDSASAKAIATEIDATIALADPLERNWLENLGAVADAFAAALSD